MSRIEQFVYNESGYKKMMSYKSWRVAILNFIDELKPENIKYMDAHQETDEAFVLLEGSAILYELIDDKIIGTKMEKNTIYNVKQGEYHSHALSNDCKLLIIEEESTNDSNTKRIYLTDEQQQEIIKIWRQVWNIN